MECCGCFQSKNSSGQKRNIKSKNRKNPMGNQQGESKGAGGGRIVAKLSRVETKRPLTNLSNYNQNKQARHASNMSHQDENNNIVTTGQNKRADIYYSPGQEKAQGNSLYLRNSSQLLQRDPTARSGRRQQKLQEQSRNFQKKNLGSGGGGFGGTQKEQIESPQSKNFQKKGDEFQPSYEPHLTMMSMRNNLYLSKGLIEDEGSHTPPDDTIIHENSQMSQQQHNQARYILSQNHLDRLFTYTKLNGSLEEKTANLDYENDSYAAADSDQIQNTKENNNADKDKDLNIVQLYAIKSYKYFCSNCQKPFQNHECMCPFCHQSVNLILSTNFFIGTSEQMEQYDLMCNGDNLHLMESEYLDGVAAAYTNSQKNLTKIVENQFCAPSSKVRQSQNVGNPKYQGTLSAQIIEYNEKSNVDPIILKNDLDSQSQMSQLMTQASTKTQHVLFKHKFQKLKSSKKYAQMLIVAEVPLNFTKLIGQNKSSMFQNNTEQTEDKSNQINNNTNQKSQKDQEGARNSPKIFHSQLNLKDYQNQNRNSYTQQPFNPMTATISSSNQHQFSISNPQLQKYMPPDIIHQVDKYQCKNVNKDVMRFLINQKMNKNKSYADLRRQEKKGDKAQPQEKQVQIVQQQQQMEFQNDYGLKVQVNNKKQKKEQHQFPQNGKIGNLF